MRKFTIVLMTGLFLLAGVNLFADDASPPAGTADSVSGTAVSETAVSDTTVSDTTVSDTTVSDTTDSVSSTTDTAIPGEVPAPELPDTVPTSDDALAASASTEPDARFIFPAGYTPIRAYRDDGTTRTSSLPAELSSYRSCGTIPASLVTRWNGETLVISIAASSPFVSGSSILFKLFPEGRNVERNDWTIEVPVGDPSSGVYLWSAAGSGPRAVGEFTKVGRLIELSIDPSSFPVALVSDAGYDASLDLVTAYFDGSGYDEYYLLTLTLDELLGYE